MSASGGKDDSPKLKRFKDIAQLVQRTVLMNQSLDELEQIETATRNSMASAKDLVRKVGDTMKKPDPNESSAGPSGIEEVKDAIKKMDIE